MSQESRDEDLKPHEPAQQKVEEVDMSIIGLKYLHCDQASVLICLVIYSAKHISSEVINQLS